MPVSHVPSAEQLVQHTRSTARQRKRNQIHTAFGELGALLPLQTSQSVDKISVVRITSSYIRFQNFMKTVYDKSATTSCNGFSELLSMAMDGFLLVTDKDANILYVSENITDYVGLAQLDVIGQSLFDITHSEEEDTIKKNLKPQGTSPNQSRQFYVKFKSTISPGRMQRAQFISHIMVKVSGKLKFYPDPKVEGGGEVTGLVAECHLIESSASILEISIFQSSFNLTLSPDRTILSVDTIVEESIGFTMDDLIGTKLSDYLHPDEHELLKPNRVRTIMMRTGHYISPLFRFMACTGEWVWMQLEAHARYEDGKPLHAEVKIKVMSDYSGKAQMKELYGAREVVDSAVMTDPHCNAYFVDQFSNKPCEKSGESVVKALQEQQGASTITDILLHSRELGLQNLPTCIEEFGHMFPPEFKHLQTSHPKSLLSSSPAQTLSTQPSPLDSTLTPSPPLSISHTSSDTAIPLSVVTSSSSTQLPSSLQPIQDSLVSHNLLPSQTPSLPPIQPLPVSNNVFTESASSLSLTSSHSVSPPSVHTATFEQSGSVSNSEDSFQSSLDLSPDAGSVFPSYGASVDAMLVNATSFQQPPLAPNHQRPQTQTNDFLTTDFTTLDTSDSLLSSGNEGYSNPDLLMSADPDLFLGNEDSEALEQLLGEVASPNCQAISAAVPTGEVPLLTNNSHPPVTSLGNVVQPTALVYSTAQAVDTVAPAMLFGLPQQNDDLQEFLDELMNPP